MRRAMIHRAGSKFSSECRIIPSGVNSTGTLATLDANGYQKVRPCLASWRLQFWFYRVASARSRERKAKSGCPQTGSLGGSLTERTDHHAHTLVLETCRDVSDRRITKASPLWALGSARTGGDKAWEGGRAASGPRGRSGTCPVRRLRGGRADVCASILPRAQHRASRPTTAAGPGLPADGRPHPKPSPGKPGRCRLGRQATSCKIQCKLCKLF
jgi:hypothetical protein